MFQGPSVHFFYYVKSHKKKCFKMWGEKTKKTQTKCKLHNKCLIRTHTIRESEKASYMLLLFFFCLSANQGTLNWWRWSPGIQFGWGTGPHRSPWGLVQGFPWWSLHQSLWRLASISERGREREEGGGEGGERGRELASNGFFQDARGIGWLD